MIKKMFDCTDAKDRPPRNCVQLPDDPWSVITGSAGIAAAKASEPPPARTWGAKLLTAICAWLRNKCF